MKQTRYIAALTTMTLCVFTIISRHAKAKQLSPPAAISGTRSVCATGCDYPNIKAAIADIQANGLDGALTLELAPTYLSTGEALTGGPAITFTNLTGVSATNTVTLRPQAGATNLILTGDNATAIIDLNNADYITIDGRPGGVGTAKELTIENTSTSAATVRFINGAENNTVKYTSLKGATTSSAAGVVSISDGGTNNSNTIDNCNIEGSGVATPSNGVYAGGGFLHSGNIVSNCNIFNFYTASGDASGVRIDSGSGTAWTITGNSFYQTASRTGTSSTVRAIHINSTAGDNFTVTNNLIGGSAASAGATAWTTTGTSAAYRFVGIQLNVGTATPSNVQGNTVKNIFWATSSNAATLPGVWTGIHAQAGSVNIGTTASNTIGSGTGTGSVSVTTSGNNGTTFGIGAAGSGMRVISNNAIGSIRTNGTTTSISASLVGIQVTAGTNTISNNTVGSTSDANSLNAGNSSTTGNQQVAGILISSTGGATITGNTIANLNNNYSGTSASGQIRGIVTATGSSGPNTITGNTVRNLSTSSGNPGAESSASVVGISEVSIALNQIISQNTVHSLSSTRSPSAVNVVGIFNGAATFVVSRNSVHSLTSISNSAATSLIGIIAHTGFGLYANNMVRLGIDSTGASVSGNYAIRGIEDQNTAESNSYYNNSVYIGGSGIASSSSPTHALFSSSLDPRAFQNNIFVNGRSNSSGSAKHYAVRVAGLVVNTGGLTSDNNIFFVSGTGGVLGFFDSADRTTIHDWRRATGQDVSSAFVDPLFVDPTAATPNLHLQASNPAEASGGAIASVTDDFDGETRNSLTPTDIGADAGNFTLSSDAFLPAISYTLLADDPSTNRMLTSFATITDNVGVSGGASSPRFYFKKATDADVFGGNTSADNGWKFVTASNATSPYSFTIDESIIYGGNITNGNTIQYFVVAQDAANNLASNPLGAGFSSNPPVQNISTKQGTVNSYNVAGAISGNRTVCEVGCDYTSLTRADGVFAAINNFSTLAGNLVISISGDLTEDGTTPLQQWTESGAGNYTLTIQPSDGSMKTISGNVSGIFGMIRLNGADRVIIDGRFNNAGRFLTFRNTFADSNDFGGVTILFNDATSNTVRSSVIEGAATFFGLGVIQFVEDFGSTGNHNNTVTDNLIRDRSDAAGVPYSLIYGEGGHGNTISDNELFNFSGSGIFIRFGDSWTISGNTIYQTEARTSSLIGIEFLNTRDANLITQNTIRDLHTSGGSIGMELRGTTTGHTTVSRNRLYSFPNAMGVNSFRTGILYFGSDSVTLVNNQITIVSSAGNSAAGLADFGSGVFNAYFNSVLIGGTASGTSSTWASLRGGSSTHTSRNNIYFNNRTGGTGNHFAVGNHSTSGTFSSNYNLFVGTGATAADFMDFGTASGGTPVSFAQWQSSTGGDANSQAGNPGGNFTSAMFVNPALGDLHIVPAGNPLISNTGTPVSGITTDFDNETRDATTPDIGSDEFGASVCLSQTNSNWSAAATWGCGHVPTASDAVVIQTGHDVFLDVDPLASSITVNGSLTIDDGGATLANDLQVNGTLNFGSGPSDGAHGPLGTIANNNLITGNNVVNIACAGAILGASPNGFVVGNVKKNYCAVGSFSFPVGTNTHGNEYSPVEVNVTALGANPSSLMVKPTYGTAPANPALNEAQTLDRFWTLTESGDLTADVTFNYLAGDVTAPEGNHRILRITGLSAFNWPNSAPDTINHKATAAGVNAFSDWTLSVPSAPTAAAANISGQVTTLDGRPLGGVTIRLSGARSGRTITKANGEYHFSDLETNGFYTVTPALANYSMIPFNRSFTLVGNKSDAVFSAASVGESANSLDSGDFFVRQQYLDFLDREPDQAGWVYWTDQIAGCGDDILCTHQRRVDVSAAFFVEQEFQGTGSFVYRLYQGSLGRQPKYAEFTADRDRVRAGTNLEEDKTALVDEWTGRPEFIAGYPEALTHSAFVSNLFEKAGLADRFEEQQRQIAAMDAGRTRAQVLRELIELQAFKDREYNRSFVLMQYFGYLRRDVDRDGYNFWLSVLNNGGPGNYRGMVCAFITSTEYQRRFSAVVTHSNVECAR